MGNLGPFETNPQTGEPFLRLRKHPNIILTPPREDDIPNLLPPLNDDRVHIWLARVPFPYTYDHARNWLNQIIPDCVQGLKDLTNNSPFLSQSPVRYLREIQDDGSELFVGDIGFIRCPEIPFENPKHDSETNLTLPPGDPNIIWTIGDWKPIKLFDLTSTLSPQPWSPHTWRTRFILNYKKIPYTTEYIGISGIAPVLQAIGALPTRETEPRYSVPAIIDPNADPPVVLADSVVIASYLEKTYPEPSIYPHGQAAHEKWTAAIVENVLMRMGFLVMPTTSRILPPVDAEYFDRSRKEIFGIDVKDMVSGAEEEARLFRALQEGLNAVSALSDEVDHGDKWLFGTADGPGFADFVLAGLFIWFDKAGPDGGWAKIKGWNGGKWAKLIENVQPFMQVL